MPNEYSELALDSSKNSASHIKSFYFNNFHKTQRVSAPTKDRKLNFWHTHCK